MGTINQIRRGSTGVKLYLKIDGIANDTRTPEELKSPDLPAGVSAAMNAKFVFVTPSGKKKSLTAEVFDASQSDDFTVDYMECTINDDEFLDEKGIWEYYATYNQIEQRLQGGQDTWHKQSNDSALISVV